MKTNLLLLLTVALFITTAQAQISITDSDMPSTNNIYLRDKAGNTSIIDLSVTGANTTWDYSALTSNGLDTINYVSVSSTPLAYQFYFNNPLSPNYNSDLAIDGLDFPTIPNSPVTITNVINYFKISSDGYYQTGFGATISSIPASIKYSPRDKVLPFPCTYGITESNDFAWDFQIPALGSYGQQKTRTVEVDGWGTLKLPNGGNYDVLRVKSTISGIDTIYVDQLGFGFSVPRTQIEYKWYAKNEGEPVLTVNVNVIMNNPVISGANYKHHEPNGLQKINMLQTGLIANPNPAVDMVSIKYFTPEQGNITIELSDIAGKKVISVNDVCTAHINNEYKIDISMLPKGYYNLQVTQNGSVNTAKLIIN
ncbi:MAG: T9SS type A sorting domain-containing protein [Bacteroidia bacterium]|nr:T9SS type A sorting domain-containing protein [Bacteroidia bacterium]MCZ2248835.1 T9SS type A sorting domain-containing protein [Bacteroidia bacterium]